MKHAIEDLADSVGGVNDIDNRVRVSQGAGHSSRPSKAESSNTASRGPGSPQRLAGESLSSSSTAKPPED